MRRNLTQPSPPPEPKAVQSASHTHQLWRSAPAPRPRERRMSFFEGRPYPHPIPSSWNTPQKGSERLLWPPRPFQMWKLIFRGGRESLKVTWQSVAELGPEAEPPDPSPGSFHTESLCTASWSVREGKTPPCGPPPCQSPPFQDHLVPGLQTMLPIDPIPPSPHHSYKHTLSCAHRVMGKECHQLPAPRALGSHTHHGTCSLGDRRTHAGRIKHPHQNIHLAWDTSGSLPYWASIRGAVVPIKEPQGRKISNMALH